MAKVQQANDFLQIKQSTDRDVRQLGVLVSQRYEADSTASQTVINLTFSVTQTTEQKRAFQLYVDGQLLREGAANDFTFTNAASGASSQVTLNASIAAGLNIIALVVGGYSDLFPNPSSVTAALNTTNLQLDNKGNANRLINGSFDFWQRGTSFAAIADGSYFADRWKYNKTSAAVHTITRDTDVPTLASGTYSANATITTADASVAAGDLVTMGQMIEGNILKPLKGKNIVFQFWVKSPKAGIHCVSFLNSAQNKNIVKEYTVSVANTWEQKQIRFNHDSTGTWLYDTGAGMRVYFALMAGSTFQGTKDVWTTSQIYATSNQVNVCDVIGNAFKISDCMMVEDNTATTAVPNFVLAGNSYAQELQLCQRYFYKSFDINVTPANGADATSIVDPTNTINILDFNYIRGAGYTFPIAMRIAPMMTKYGNSSGQWGYAKDNVAVVYSATPGFNQISSTKFTTSQQIFGGAATLLIHLTADAEL